MKDHVLLFCFVSPLMARDDWIFSIRAREKCCLLVWYISDNDTCFTKYEINVIRIFNIVFRMDFGANF